MCLALVARGRGACAGGSLDVLNRRPAKRLLAVCVRRVRLGIGAACLQRSRSDMHQTRHSQGKETSRLAKCIQFMHGCQLHRTQTQPEMPGCADRGCTLSTHDDPMIAAAAAQASPAG